MDSRRPPHIFGPLAQLVEQETLNLLVVGSIPTRPTIKNRKLKVDKTSHLATHQAASSGFAVMVKTVVRKFSRARRTRRSSSAFQSRFSRRRPAAVPLVRMPV